VKTLRSAARLMVVAFVAVPCFAHHMAVIVSPDNSVQDVSSAQLSKIFRSETKKWPSGRSITLVLHRASAGEAVTVERLNKMSAREWQSWVAEHHDSVKVVDSDEEVLSYVASTPGAIGLIDVRSVNDRVKVVRVDGKFPLEDGYLPH
jgi:ABC-type phosphate transport system substrate-binding protein